MSEKPTYAELEQRVRELEAVEYDLKNTQKELRESELRYRIITDNTYDWEFWTDADGRFLYTSPSCERITGRCADEFYTNSDLILKIIHPEDLPIFQLHRQNNWYGQEKDYIEFRIVRPDGEVRWVEHACQEVFDPAGKHLGWRGSNRDRTERKRAEELLFISEQKYRQLVETSSDWIWTLDLAGKITYSNSAIGTMLGYTDDEAVHLPFFAMMHPEDAPRFREMSMQSIQSRTGWSNCPIRWLTKGDRICYTESSAQPLFDSKGTLSGFMGIDRDSTDRKIIEDALQESEKRFRLIAETITEVFWIADINIESMQYVSPGYERIWGLTVESLYNNPFSFVKAIHEDDREQVLFMLAEQKKNSKPFDQIYRILRPDGEIRWIWDRGFPIVNEKGQANEYLGIAQDITDRKRTEEALLEKENLFHTTFMGSPVASSLLRREDRFCIDINQAEVDMFGYSREESVGRIRTTRLWDDIQDREMFNKDLLKHGKAKNEFARLRHKEGRLIIASVSATVLTLKGTKHILYTSEDITERKQAEEALINSEKLFRTVFLESPVALSFCQPENGMCLDINQAEVDMFGYSREDVVGTNRLADVWDDMADRERFIKDLINNGKAKNECVRLRHKNGRLIFASISAGLLTLNGVKHSIIASEDITERKNSENLIQKNLLEKEVLLKEIHHRVKNNLAVISSLIGLQANRIEENAVKEMLTTCQNRIQSMALVHEKLYRSENLSAIDFNGYIKSIIDELTSTYRLRMKPIRVHTAVQEVLLGIDKAVPCALIVNELIVNALKYAFSGIENPELTVCLEKTGRVHTLTVKDNGNGVMESPGFTSNKTLGLMIVRSLTRQLEGKLQLIADPSLGHGITAILNFEA